MVWLWLVACGGGTADAPVVVAPPGESTVTFPVTIGDELLIQVGTFSETTATGAATLTIECDGVVPNEPFKRAEANGDGTVNVADGIYILGFLFAGGPAPLCLDSADANDDETINLADTIWILSWNFGGGPPPPSPGPFTCGLDPFGTGLDCAIYNGCP